MSLVQAGPLARSIDDLELLWNVIRGADPSDFEIAPIDWQPPSGRSLEQLRFAWTDGFEPYVAGTETRAARGLLKGHPRVVKLLRRALKMITQDYAAALGIKRLWVADMERFFGDHDVLLAPVSYGPAFKRSKEGSPLDFDGRLGPYNDYCEPYVAPSNASGHPALVMPLGTSRDGLPIGVRLVGPYWSEPEFLHIARQLAPLTQGFVAPSGS